jgi:hypothetical protein
MPCVAWICLTCFAMRSDRPPHSRRLQPISTHSMVPIRVTHLTLAPTQAARRTRHHRHYPTRATPESPRAPLTKSLASETLETSNGWRSGTLKHAAIRLFAESKRSRKGQGDCHAFANAFLNCSVRSLDASGCQPIFLGRSQAPDARNPLGIQPAPWLLS